MTPNQRVHILGEGRLLQIQPTQVSDSGRYLCVATNMAGEDDQDFNVLIQGVWGHGAGVSGTWGVSVLLGRPGRRALFSSLSAHLAPRTLAWALSRALADRDITAPPGLSFTFVIYG